MENASKALLIGAAILFSVMVLSLLMMGYKQISSYFSAEHESIVIEQTTKFNAQFENYNQKSIRGSDMISFMNKVIDYNERLSYMDGTNYKRLEITINFFNNDILEQFKYSTTERDFTNTSIFPTNFKITNVTDTGIPPTTVEQSRILDKQLLGITEVVENLKSNNLNGRNVTDSELQNLASNISNIFLNIANFDNPSVKITETTTVPDINNLTTTTQQNIVATRQKRNDLIKNILNVELTLNNNGVVTDMTKLKLIKEMALKYYQVQQFKRAYFECTGTEYDEETGRILKMNFEVKTNADGTVIFN